MKTTMTCIVVLLFSMISMAQLQTPDLSPRATLKQSIGLTDMEINYSRPSVKGRVIFDDEGLLPDGEFWRVGANTAIKLSFNRDIILGGMDMEKGDYSMLVKPYDTRWEFYVYPYISGNWTAYVKEVPVAQFSVPVKKRRDIQETFEISIQDMTSNTANLELHWENTQVFVPMQFGTQEVVMQRIEQTMQGPSWNDYYQAALYMHEHTIDLPKALTYIQKATTSDNAMFFVVYREALILKDLNRKEEALAAAKRALKLSKKAENKDFIRLNERLIRALSL